MKAQIQNFSELENSCYYFAVLAIFNQSFFIYFISTTENCKPPIWLSLEKDNQLIITKRFSRRNGNSKQKKLAASNKENCEEHPRSNLAQNSIVPRSQEDYITQASEEIEERVTRKNLAEQKTAY